MKIAVAGMGYVGLSLAVLLAQHCDVVAVDVLPEKVEKINAGRSPIQDREIEELLASGKLRLRATLDARAAYRAADSVVIAAPTNYDPQRNYFDTSAVENVIGLAMEANPEALLVIKSTVPVGFSQHIRAQMGVRNLLFSPEFLRESRALYDNLYPSRIIVGTDMEDARLVEKAREFAGLLREGARKKEVDTLIMGYTEAEAVKLFANTYLALRVSFFNELDTYAELKGLDARRIIEGVLIRALARITTILPLAMADIACPRIPSSFWPIIGCDEKFGSCHRGGQPHAQRFYCRPRFAHGGVLRSQRRLRRAERANGDHWRIPAHDENRQRQF